MPSLSFPFLSFFISFFISFFLPFLLPFCLACWLVCFHPACRLLPLPYAAISYRRPPILSEPGPRLSWILVGKRSRDDRECEYHFGPSTFLQDRPISIQGEDIIFIFYRPFKEDLVFSEKGMNNLTVKQ